MTGNQPVNVPDATIQELRELLANCGASNQHERAVVAICGCIMSGIDTGPQIIEVLVQLGFNQKHAGMMLQEGKGNAPASHHWRRDNDGRYSLHD